ncbi:MAG: hypothetical protein HFG01_07195 [Oscillibacter sp.]|jgi:hypothetical protein|nr:hypothetical protein [Oscillibacter sp.]
MKRRRSNQNLWNYGFAGLFGTIGLLCLWLDRRREYDFHMAAWGLGWLALGAGTLCLALRERRREVPRDLQPLALGLAYALISGPHLEQGLGTGSGFHVAAGICWLALAALWLLRAVRQFRNTTHKEDAV